MSAKPKQHRLPRHSFKEYEYSLVYQEIHKLLQKSIIIKVKDPLRTIIKLVTLNCFMTSTDMKDAYYSKHPHIRTYGLLTSG